jgi:putative SOS response-associated peptidase YedK
MEFASKTLNARIETCAEKASFRHLIGSKRCLVPSSGFFEWQTAGKLKIPYFITDPKQEIFSIAGIYDSWLDHSTGALENTFTILTTAANPLMAEIHNTKKRMPLILATNEEDAWLAGKLSLENIMDRSAIQLEAWEVDKRIILSSNANISMVSQRYQNPQGIQKGLFD